MSGEDLERRYTDVGPMKWRVQAFLLPAVTGADEFPYAPTYYRFEWQARRQVRGLRRSFAGGMVRIDIERITREQA